MDHRERRSECMGQDSSDETGPVEHRVGVIMEDAPRTKMSPVLPDIAMLGISELEALQRTVAERVTQLRLEAKDAALAEMRQVAARYELAWEEVVIDALPRPVAGRPRRAARRSMPPRYRHPDDSSVTWSGTGRKPRWIVALLEAGRTLDELEIAVPASSAGDRPEGEETATPEGGSMA